MPMGRFVLVLEVVVIVVASVVIVIVEMKVSEVLYLVYINLKHIL